MTAYRDFIEDFPQRCREILEFAADPARARGREVTLTLMVASAGLIVPYERLKPDGDMTDHPSGDNKKFAEAAAELKGLLGAPFLDSPLWNAPAGSWHDGKVVNIRESPDSWTELQRKRPLQAGKTVGGVFRVVRNALAHGNIFTYNNPIEALVFVSANYSDHERPAKDFSFLYVSPKDFCRFLKMWFAFLGQIRIPQDVTYRVLQDAA